MSTVAAAPTLGWMRGKGGRTKFMHGCALTPRQHGRYHRFQAICCYWKQAGSRAGNYVRGRLSLKQDKMIQSPRGIIRAALALAQRDQRMPRKESVPAWRERDQPLPRKESVPAWRERPVGMLIPLAYPLLQSWPRLCYSR